MSYVFSGISIIIVALNYTLKDVVIRLINYIGYYYKSDVLSRIVVAVFISQFTNTGFILLIASANFDNTPLSFINIKNQFSDYSSHWYEQVGSQIVQTMLIQAFMPYVTGSFSYLIIQLKRVCDGGVSKNTTNKTAIHQYIKLYSGPDVLLHFRYSVLLNQIFVCFTYGLALP